MNVRYLILLPLALLFITIGCGKDSSPIAGHRHDEHGHNPAEPTGPTNRVEIPPVVRSNLGITFAQVERRHVASTKRVPGRFELRPTARREYRLILPGHVELLVDQYDEVEAGQPIFRFRSAQWTALQGAIAASEQAIVLMEAELRVSEASLQETRHRLEILQTRMAMLSGAEVRRADLELQAAEVEASLARMEAERDLAHARLRSARESFDQAVARAAAVLGLSHHELLEPNADSQPLFRTLDSITMRAASGGIVEFLAITNGAYVEDGSLVMTIVNPERLRFRASLLQADLERAGRQSIARIAPPQTAGASLSEHVEATLALGLEASPQQRTIELIAQPHEHRAWMRPGVSAFLEIVLDGTDRPELAIPRSALMKDGLTHVFFRRDPRDPNAAIRVEADLAPAPGIYDGRWVVIRSGLRLGDEVVLDGAYELMLATSQSGASMMGGHFHPDGTWHADH